MLRNAFFWKSDTHPPLVMLIHFRNALAPAHSLLHYVTLEWPLSNSRELRQRPGILIETRHYPEAEKWRPRTACDKLEELPLLFVCE